jgi:hypothetical protein
MVHNIWYTKRTLCLLLTAHTYTDTDTHTHAHITETHTHTHTHTHRESWIEKGGERAWGRENVER